MGWRSSAEPQAGSGVGGERRGPRRGRARPCDAAPPPEPGVESLLSGPPAQPRMPHRRRRAGLPSWPASGAGRRRASERVPPLSGPSRWGVATVVLADQPGHWTPCRSRRPLLHDALGEGLVWPGGDRRPSSAPRWPGSPTASSSWTGVGFEGREAAQAETIRKMVIAMARDMRVLMIKLADRAAQHAHASVATWPRSRSARPRRRSTSTPRWPTASACTTIKWELRGPRPSPRCYPSGTTRSTA